MVIDIEQNKSGVNIPLRVQPKASANRIAGEHAGSLKVLVTVPPEGGKANEAAIKVIAKKLNVPKSSITIVAGRTSRQKRIHIAGVKADKIEKMLESAR